MTKVKVWIAKLATPAAIAMLLLCVGTANVSAEDQPSARNGGGENR